jgi:hypothetical protein
MTFQSSTAPHNWPQMLCILSYLIIMNETCDLSEVKDIDDETSNIIQTLWIN